jgi:hypothetical protein
MKTRELRNVRMSLLMVIGIAGFSFSQSLVASWSFDSSSGNTYYDITGHGYDLVTTNLNTANGIKGKALSFPGSNFYARINNSAGNFTFQAFSVEAWVFPYVDLSTAGYQVIFDNGNGLNSGGEAGFNIQMNSGKVRIDMGTGASWISVNGTTMLQSQKWYYLAATYDGHQIKLYVNGAKEGSTSWSGGYALNPDTARIGVGKSRGAIGYYFNGKIDEVSLNNYALDSSVIPAHYAAMMGPIPKLIACASPTLERKPIFRWHSLDSVSAYIIQIDTLRSFKLPIISLPLSDTSYIPSVNLPLDTIYWRVKVANDQAEFSNVSSFIIQDAAIPILIPVVPNPTQERRQLLQWHKVAGAASYHILIDDTHDFSSVIISTPLTDTSYKPAMDLPQSVIYWKVKSDLSAAFSAADSFTIQSDTVPLLYAFAGKTITIKRPVFAWKPVQRATSYRIQIDTLPLFASPLFSLPLNDTLYTPNIDLKARTYYWRVSCNLNFDVFCPADSFIIGATGVTMHKMPSAGLQIFSPGISGNALILTLDKPRANFLCTLIDLKGRVLASWQGANISGKKALPLHNPVPKGIYIVKFYSGNRLLHTKTIIKMI